MGYMGILYPKPYSIYLRGTLSPRTAAQSFRELGDVRGAADATRLVVKALLGQAMIGGQGRGNMGIPYVGVILGKRAIQGLHTVP